MKVSINNHPFYDFWFKESSKDIYIVCSRVESPPRDAHKYSNDYAYSDNFGDKDSLFESYAMLARNYPGANIHFYYSDDFIEKVRYWEKKNILIIGGPNSRNHVCQYFMYEVLPTIYDKLQRTAPRYMHPPKYQKDQRPFENRDYCKEVICNGCNKLNNCPRLALCVKENSKISLITPEVWDEVIVSETEINLKNFETPIREIRNIGNGKVGISGCVKKDIGLFASFQNPFDENQNNQIVMISGLYTFGVVGTCRAMGATNRTSIDNYNSLYYEFIDSKSRDFMVYLDIHINQQREVRFAKLDISRVVSFSEKNTTQWINNVFISYRRKTGKAYAHQLFDLLKSQNDKKIYPFIDQKYDNSNFIPGVDYVTDIQTTITKCDVFISIISPDCFVTDTDTDGGYKAEWFWAIKTSEIIIPIECGASYFEELSKIEAEVITFFGKDVYKNLSHINSVPISQNNLIETIEYKLKQRYSQL